jgi:hypothetical protein
MVLTINNVYRESPTASSRKMMPTDSIFCYNGMGLEKVVGMNQVAINNDVQLFEVTKGYQLIDVANKRMLFLDSINKVSVSPTSNWQPLSQKRMGVPIDFLLYHNEKYSEKDTVYKNDKAKIIHYYNQSGKWVSILFGDSLQDNDLFFYDLERKFKKRIKYMCFKNKLGGESVTIVDVAPLPNDKHPAVSLLTKLSN